ncbi:hypothetical protein DTO164E3_6192 [Paecilomyces variotii]|nr:hypothetical protein DTO164E3_6192 [Paecilomyces variotii]KAJ9359685.1 hypothetical protein DTO027B9_1733 [Paecilomyces variotii]
MEGNAKGKDGTDDAPIRPVSSLLSHFENLAHLRSSSGASSPRNSSQFLRTPEPTEDIRGGRQSLDLPSPRSPWGSTPSTQNGQSPSPLVRTSGAPGASASPRRRAYSRPMSMDLHSSQVTPALTVDSPRSPPHALNNGHGSESSPRMHQFSHSIAEIEGVPRPRPPRAQRPTTPNFSLGGGGTGEKSDSPGRGVSPIGKSASVPPPVNRADKPKIPAKAANLGQLEFQSSSLTPTAARSERAPVDERVSPFSTPPSSPEKPSPRTVPSERPEKFKIPPLRPTTEPPPRSAGPDRPQPSTSAVRDARELGFSRQRPVPEPSRATKPVMVPVAPLDRRSEILSSGPREARFSEPSNHKIPASAGPDDRPGLPPRFSTGARPFAHSPPTSESRPEPGRRSLDVGRSRSQRVSPSRRVSAIDTTFPPPPRRETGGSTPASTSAGGWQGNDISANGPNGLDQSRGTRRHSPQPPPVSRDTKYTSSTPIEQNRNPRVEEPDRMVEETPIPRTDYPDSSQVNRRPPVIKGGPSAIPTKYDTRLFDVCGRYVCTAGYLTRVWDLTTGEMIMSLSHGETVKVMSLAFKAGKGLEDEGQRLWLGTNIGELHEVDISTQSIVASRSYPSRREIIKIYRHKKEMWTLDDEGRLLVWPPDESGTPNLQYSYSNPYDRVARGHTFSLVVGDTLWLATGKDVRIYRPNAREDTSFQVLRRPLGQHHSGEVTCGAYTTKDGGRVYLGHADGKVTIYSSTNYACLGSVNVSVYKINCLAMVGDYLWAAYKTGMIYVYDVNTNPWTVKKDWRAHDDPVCGLLLDPSSVWTVNRLQVASLGTDNCIRLWDGMLEEDWLETRMQSKDVEYCTFREVRAVVVTWNAGASVPGSVRHSSFIRDAIHPEDPPEIIVFGFQELVDLEDKKITAKSLFKGSKKKDGAEKEHMSRQYRVWRDHLATAINDCMPLDENYVLLHTANLVGLFTCVFIKHRERQRIRNISAAEVKRGMGGLHGNKGALILRFVLDDSSICLVNCHLAAGQSHTASRNNDIAAILESESLPAETSLTTRADLFVGGGDGTMILDHEICILNGDLNYRIDSIPRNVIIEDIKNNNLPKLLDRDQLLASRRKNPGFRLRSFNEAPITFAPTYKYDVGSDEYDSSEKKRAPAWCDRVLSRGPGRIKQLEYRRHEVKASDHRPVSASFKMRIKTVSPQERAQTWEECQKAFAKEKRRLASEASIEYLVTVLGTDPEEATRLIKPGSSK